MASATQDFMDPNRFPFDGAPAVGTRTAASPNVQPQSAFALAPGAQTGAFFPQGSHEAPYPMVQDLAFQTSRGAMPPATTGSFPNSVRIRHRRRQLDRAESSQIHETSLSGDGHAWMSTTPHPVEQPLWLPPPMLHLVEVPQRVYDVGRRQRNPGQPGSIFFSVNGFPGINVQDALVNGFAGLDGRDDLIFQNQDVGPAISCRFLFPGYPKNPSAQISTKGWKRNRISITRSKLAREIAKKLKQYIDSMAGHPIENSADRCWEIGNGFMRFENMYLVSLVPVSKGSFQPEVWVAI